MINRLGVLLVAAIILAGQVRAAEAWKAVDEPEDGWLKVKFVEGGEPRTAWCRAALCADIKDMIKNSLVPLFHFEPAGVEKNSYGLVTIYQSSESPYALVSKIGVNRVERDGRRIDEKPRYQRTTDPDGRDKMRVLPPKTCPPDCEKDQN